MTRKEMNLVSMFKTTDLFLTTNNEAIKNYESVVQSHLKIKTGISDIEALSGTQSIGTKVQTELKTNEKTDLDTIVIKVTNAMSAEAAATNNVELKIKASLTKSTLLRLRQIDYHNKIQAIYKAALPIADKLAVWGVTMEDIEALNEKSNSYINRTPDIRNVRVVSKQASADMKKKIYATYDEIKLTLDNLMKPFSSLNPTLYGQYLNARAVVDIAATQKPKPKEEVAAE